MYIPETIRIELIDLNKLPNHRTEIALSFENTILRTSTSEKENIWEVIRNLTADLISNGIHVKRDKIRALSIEDFFNEYQLFIDFEKVSDIVQLAADPKLPAEVNNNVMNLVAILSAYNGYGDLVAMIERAKERANTGEAVGEQKSVITRITELLFNREDKWEIEKQGEHKLTGVIKDVTISFSGWYVLGNCYLEGTIGEKHVRIFKDHNGVQVHTAWAKEEYDMTRVTASFNPQWNERFYEWMYQLTLRLADDN